MLQYPPVTIAIPTYNRRVLLERALRSASYQTYSDLEILVCDDGSTDGTREFLESCTDPRIRCVFPSTNRGMYANFCTALNEARGEYFLMLDDHDYLEPTAVEALMQPWLKFSTLAFSYGQYWYHDHLGERLLASEGPELENGFDYVENYWFGKRATLLYACLFRKQALAASGGFSNLMALDTLAFLRAAFQGDVALVAQPTTHYELQKTSFTHNIPLIRLVRERDEMLQACMQAARRSHVPKERLDNLESHARKELARQSAATVLLMRGRGLSRIDLWREFRPLIGYLRYRWALGALSMTLAFLLSPPAVNWVRRSRRKLEQMPADDASLGLRPGQSEGRL